MQLKSVPGSAAAALIAPDKAQALLAQAGLLQAGVESLGLLRGRRLGLMQGASRGAEAELVRQAAMELGAQVAQIPAQLDQASSPRQIEETARLLGQLYDAVVCEGMDSTVVERLERCAGIPVYAGLADGEHPSADLARHLPGPAALSDKRRWLLQAMLLDGMG